MGSANCAITSSESWIMSLRPSQGNQPSDRAGVRPVRLKVENLAGGGDQGQE